jgi:hypothetical protein
LPDVELLSLLIRVFYGHIELSRVKESSWSLKGILTILLKFCPRQLRELKIPERILVLCGS